MTEQLNEHFIALLWGFLLGGVINWIAWKRGFFNVLSFSSASPIAYYDVIRTFFIFLSVEILVAPLVALIFYSFKLGHLISEDLTAFLSFQAVGWFNLLAIVSGAAAVFLSFHWMSKAKRQSVWGVTDEKLKSFFLGSVMWLASFPAVVVVGQIVWLVLFAFGIEVNLEQVAVKHLKQILPYPILLTSTVAIVIFIVPIVEELLFRGLLQSWLVAKWGRTVGIGLASLIFALFHFSFSQGIANIELLVSLFILACFLGFLYLKQRSLWAPIGLHMTFNAFSSFALILAEH